MSVFEAFPKPASSVEKHHVQRPRTTVKRPQRASSRASNRQNEFLARLPVQRLSLSPDHKTSFDPSWVRPGDLLSLAACHVRRLSAIALRSSCSSRVLDVLRCRQWSSISLDFDGVGRTPFLDGAVRCLEAKLRQIAFDNISPLLVLSEYDRALQCLHEVVQDRNPAQDRRVLTAIQLLAIFEMLDGPDNSRWQQHASGARSLYELQLPNSVRMKACQRRPLLQLAPMLADALLDNNCDFVQRTSWRPLLNALLSKQTSRLRQDANALVTYFTDLFGLMVESERIKDDASLGTRFDVLSRAQGIKFQIKTALLEGGMESLIDSGDIAQFDIVGLSMAGLFALDRIITAMAPGELDVREFLPEKTDEVCIRLLQCDPVRADLKTVMGAIVKAQHQC